MNTINFLKMTDTYLESFSLLAKCRLGIQDVSASYLNYSLFITFESKSMHLNTVLRKIKKSRHKMRRDNRGTTQIQEKIIRLQT